MSRCVSNENAYNFFVQLKRPLQQLRTRGYYPGYVPHMIDLFCAIITNANGDIARFLLASPTFEMIALDIEKSDEIVASTNEVLGLCKIIERALRCFHFDWYIFPPLDDARYCIRLEELLWNMHEYVIFVEKWRLIFGRAYHLYRTEMGTQFLQEQIQHYYADVENGLAMLKKFQENAGTFLDVQTVTLG